MTSEEKERILGARIIAVDEENPGMGWPRLLLENGWEIWAIADICGEVDYSVYRTTPEP